jgi:hypothetical protein
MLQVVAGLRRRCRDVMPVVRRAIRALLLFPWVEVSVV